MSVLQFCTSEQNKAHFKIVRDSLAQKAKHTVSMKTVDLTRSDGNQVSLSTVGSEHYPWIAMAVMWLRGNKPSGEGEVSSSQSSTDKEGIDEYLKILGAVNVGFKVQQIKVTRGWKNDLDNCCSSVVTELYGEPSYPTTFEP